jgi:hypothetical protein
MGRAMTTLSPTHKCFDDALELLNQIVKQGRHRTEDWRLVHAICKAVGHEFAHGWCERNRKTVVTAFIIDGQHTYVEIPRRDYYRLFSPQEMTRYTVDEAMWENLRHYNYGPWERRYREACGSNEILGTVEVALR